MSSFHFYAVQTLCLEPEDKPIVDVQDGRLILTATRGKDKIMVIAPIDGITPPIAQTTIKTNHRSVAHQKIKKQQLHRWAGENAPLAKLKEFQIREIRQLIKDPNYVNKFGSGHSMILDLAKTYKVHMTTMYKIVNFQSWKHVEA